MEVQNEALSSYFKFLFFSSIHSFNLLHLSVIPLHKYIGFNDN